MFPRHSLVFSARVAANCMTRLTPCLQGGVPDDEVLAALQSPARPAGHDQCNITSPAAGASVCVAVVARFHDTLADVDTVI